VPVSQGRERYRVGDLVVDVGTQRVTGPAGDIALPKLSFDVFITLIRRAPDFVSNDELAARVWAGVVVSPETVTKRVNLLRDSLSDDATNPRYVAGLRSRGYRIVAPVSVEGADEPLSTDDGDGAVDTAAATGSPGPGRAAVRWRHAALLLAGVAAVVAVAWWSGHGEPAQRTDHGFPTAPQEEYSVAVLPFENLSPSPDDAYLAVGIPDMVLDRLSSIPRLTVIASGSASRAAGDSPDPTQLGQRLGARYLVFGSAQLAGGRLRVSARLVDAKSGTQVWATQIDRPLEDLFLIQDIIATQVADELRARALDIVAPASTGHQPPVEAQLAYLRGRAALARYTVRGAEEAAELFARAVELDSGFAAALAGLFDARMLAAERRHDDVKAERERQMPLVVRALEIDPQCGSAYIARAIWGDGEPAQQDADYRRGLELDPGNSRGLVAYSEFLDRQARFDEGSRMLDRAMLVDPLSPRLHFRLAMRETGTKGVAFREAGLKRVLELDPDYQPALQRYAKTRWMLHGKLAEAAQLMEHAIELDPDNPWSRHTATAIYLDLGDEAAARAVAEGTPSSRRTEQLLLALYRGDWRTAGEVAYSPAGREYNLAESWGASEAVRDHALQTGEFRRAIAFFEERYGLGGAEPALDIVNFRAAAYMAQLLRASGDDARARRLLERLPAAIDTTLPVYGAVLALRTRAAVLLLAGQKDAALRTLSESFEADDLMQWWYTLDHDPLWKPVHDDPVFKALAAQVRARVAVEQSELASLRHAGRVTERAQSMPHTGR
jgi:TolB-like protein/DNA-binding winged helix-turn-helix (wHTH) protein/Tfp pilus assembly protein PilF